MYVTRFGGGSIDSFEHRLFMLVLMDTLAGHGRNDRLLSLFRCIF